MTASCGSAAIAAHSVAENPRLRRVRVEYQYERRVGATDCLVYRHTEALIFLCVMNVDLFIRQLIEHHARLDIGRIILHINMPDRFAEASNDRIDAMPRQRRRIIDRDYHINGWLGRHTGQ